MQSVFSVKTDRGRTEKWLKASSYLAASAVIAALAWQFTHEAVRFSLGGSELGQAPAASSAVVEAKGQEPAAQSRPSNTHLSASIAAVTASPNVFGAPASPRAPTAARDWG